MSPWFACDPVVPITDQYRGIQAQERLTPEPIFLFLLLLLSLSLSLFFFFTAFIALFSGCAGSLLRGLFSSCSEWGLLLVAMPGFSMRRLLLLRSTGSGPSGLQ